jgi:hypothetical protein
MIPALLLPALAAGSGEAALGDQYMVEMALWIEGEQRGTPIVVIEPDAPASVAVADESGSERWKIELLVEAPSVSEGAPIGATWLNLTVYERRDGEWETLADSLLGVREGRTATMSVVGTGQEPATKDNSLVYLEAQASRLRPGQSRQ